MIGQLPFPGAPESELDWVRRWCLEHGETLTGCNSAELLARMRPSFPEHFRASVEDLQKRDIDAKLMRALKRLTVRFIEEPAGVAEEEVVIFGYAVAEMTLETLLRSCQRRLAKAEVDVRAVERDVHAWLLAHPQQHLTFEEIMHQARRGA